MTKFHGREKSLFTIIEEQFTTMNNSADIESGDWHPEDIKAEVRKTGVTLKELAERGGLSESACRKSLQVASPKSDRLISDQLKVPLHQIWPSRYDLDGRRKRAFHVREDHNHDCEKTHRQNAEAI